jgi:16S rRNA (cytosine1402-N4)-methyltransferase
VRAGRGIAPVANATSRGDRAARPSRATTQPEAHGGAFGSLAHAFVMFCVTSIPRPEHEDYDGVMSATSIHIPVLHAEVLQWLDPRPGQIIVDGTLGGGGHTRLLAEPLASSGHDLASEERQPSEVTASTDSFVLSLDRDPAAIAAAERNLAGLPVKIAQANFCELAQILDELKIDAVDAVLLDLGLSSDQLADSSRGFSFDATGPLDLRFDPGEGEAAWQLLARLPERELADVIYQFGEERFSRRIARRIVEQRTEHPIKTAAELAQLVRRSVPRSVDKIDPATRTFQALRIAVNRELDSLDEALARIPDRLKPGGRFAVVSFHSLEDRRVKEAFRSDTRLEPLTKKPVRPTDYEVHHNPRSRSAKLRVARRV